MDNYHMTFFSNICDIDIGKKETSDKHKIFLAEEIQKVIEYGQISKMARIITLYLYTGVRPSELLLIKHDDVHLDENYIIGGIKNESSKNRIIPIHPDIKDIVTELYNENHEYLFVNEDNNKPMTYDNYRHRFSTVMNELQLDHICHDTRHTFATRCEEVGITDTELKALLGHSFSNDVTNNIYIHRSSERMLEIIKKLNYT